YSAYASVFYLVVQDLRHRRDVSRLVRLLLATGGVLAFAGLIDYLSRESWIFAWREGPMGGRLAASFANPDHFATWLAMLICLGSGFLMAARASDRIALREIVASPELREEAVKHWLPFLAVGVMAVSVVFTLSRGAVVGLLAALLVLVALLGAARRIRSSLTLVAALAAVALSYSVWIGLAPLLAHVETSGLSLEHRFTQYRASAPMLLDFPLAGVGLGAYRAIYPRYQPLAHAPGAVYYPYAHNDLLQFVIETGVIGAVVLLWGAWRVGR